MPARSRRRIDRDDLAWMRLKDSEVFNACHVDNTIAMQRDETDVRKIFDMQKRLKDAERAKEASVRQAAVDELTKQNPDWKADLDRDLSSGWERTVKSFVKIESRRAAKEYGIRLVGLQWPKPRDMPTFCMLDGTHFRDAAYVDFLVTQDEVFRAVAAGTRLPLAVLSFDAFARAMLTT